MCFLLKEIIQASTTDHPKTFFGRSIATDYLWIITKGSGTANTAHMMVCYCIFSTEFYKNQGKAVLSKIDHSGVVDDSVANKFLQLVDTHDARLSH